MNEIKVGSEIRVGDRLFEVISHEYVNEDLSHVMLANGTVVEATYACGGHRDDDLDVVTITMPDNSQDDLWLGNLKHYGIVPLIEIVSEPIEFVEGTLITDDYVGAFIPVPLGFGLGAGVRFKCVQVVD